MRDGFPAARGPGLGDPRRGVICRSTARRPGWRASTSAPPGGGASAGRCSAEPRRGGDGCSCGPTPRTSPAHPLSTAGRGSRRWRTGSPGEGRRARGPDGVAGVNATIRRRVAGRRPPPARRSSSSGWTRRRGCPTVHTLGETEGFVRRDLMASGEVLVAGPGRIEGFLARRGEEIPRALRRGRRAGAGGRLRADRGGPGPGGAPSAVDVPAQRGCATLLSAARLRGGGARPTGRTPKGCPTSELTWERGA